MPLETATHVADLNAANPPGTDLLSQADDHIRLLKSVLQASFPKDLRGVASPANFTSLRYDGTSFKNYNNGCHTNLQMTPSQALTNGIETIVGYNSEIQDDLGLYSGSGSNLVIPANFPTGAFGMYASFVFGLTSSIPGGGNIRIRVLNTTSASRNPMTGAATRQIDYIIPPSSSLYNTTPHFSCLLFMQPHNGVRPLASDILQLGVTAQGFSGSIVNGNLQVFTL